MDSIKLQSDESLKTVFYDGHNLVLFYSCIYETKFSKLKYFAEQMLFVFGNFFAHEISKISWLSLELCITNFYIENQTYDQ